ncbi:MAG: GtrA family protein, partial [Puniceicoccales bacterium]|nr:GtrA family protein [Puniceicoccales bacterium]
MGKIFAITASFIRYAIVGATNTLIHFSVLVSLVEILAYPKPLSNALGFFVANLFSYYVNSKWSFGATLSRKRYILFFTTSLVGVAISYGLMYVGDSLQWHYLQTFVVQVAVMPLSSFVLMRLLVFKGAMRAPAKDELPALIGTLLRRFGELCIFGLLVALVAQITFWWWLRKDEQITVSGRAAAFICRQIERTGIFCTIQNIRFQSSGILEINGIEIRAPGAPNPAFTARHASITVRMPGLTHGKIIPTDFFLDGATFYCPESTAPGGFRRAVWRDVRIALTQDKGHLRIHTLQGRFGDMPVVLHGDYSPRKIFDETGALLLPTAKGKTTTLLNAATWQTIDTVAGKMLRTRLDLEAFGLFSVDATVRGGEAGTAALTAFVRTGALTLPGGIKSGQTRLFAAARLDGTAIQPEGLLVLDTRDTTWADPARNLSVKAERLRATGSCGPALELPETTRFTATAIEVNGEQVDLLSGTVRRSSPTEINAVVMRESDFVSISAIADLAAQSASASFTAQLTPSVYLAHPKIAPLFKKLPGILAVHQRLALDGKVHFAPGGKFAEADFTFDTGAAQFCEIKALSASGHARFTPEGVEVKRADVRTQDYRAQGDFSIGFTANIPYRILLYGNTHPRFLNPFFGPWWRTKIWDAFELDPVVLPRADIEVRGQRKGRRDEFIFCAATADKLRFRGADFEHAELRIVELPQSLNLFDMRVRHKPGMEAGGSLQFHYTPLPEHIRQSVRFHFDGLLPKDVAAALAGRGLPRYLAPVLASAPIQASATGYYHDVASPTPNREQVVVQVNAHGPLTAWKLPFSDVQTTVAYDSGQLVITVDEAVFAEGKISSKPTPWASFRGNRPQR